VKTKTRILGIDPGSITAGYGIIDVAGNKSNFIECGVIKPDTKNLGKKLAIIYRSVEELVLQFKPDEFVIEKVFVSKNPDSAIKLGQARGVAIAAAAIHEVPVFEYSANEIKKSVVGRGHATKQEVQTMITMLLNLGNQPDSDAADALACAFCHGSIRTIYRR